MRADAGEDAHAVIFAADHYERLAQQIEIQKITGLWNL